MALDEGFYGVKMGWKNFTEIPIVSLAEKVTTLHFKLTELHVKKQIASALLKVSMATQKGGTDDRPSPPDQDPVEKATAE